MRRARGTLAVGGPFVAAGVLALQARPPLSLAADPTGVLTAIRAIDIRQLCRCPTVMLDSLVRRANRARMFEVLSEPVEFSLSAADAGRLRLARHRVVRTALRTITRAAPDSALLAVAALPANPGGSRVLVVVTPPSGITSAYLVSLRRERTVWRVEGTRAVFEP